MSNHHQGPSYFTGFNRRFLQQFWYLLAMSRTLAANRTFLQSFMFESVAEETFSLAWFAL
jgi:hypothetical protein